MTPTPAAAHRASAAFLVLAALGVGLGAAPGRSAAAEPRAWPVPDRPLPAFAQPVTGLPADARAAAMDAAEALLRAGAAAAALRAYEALALREHASDIELGMVRSQLQTGDYRRAAAFGAHTAGAHAQEVGGSALYAWLLALAGQRDAARRTLEAAEPRRPGSPLLAGVRARLAQSHPVPDAALRALPHRLAPQASGAPVPEDARAVATGLLVDGGRHALVPRSALAVGQPLWLRDGLGRTVRGEPVEALSGVAAIAAPRGSSASAPATATASTALLRLRLEPALPAPEVALSLAPRDPFPGSPALSLLHADAGDAEAAWPWLNQGFLGRPAADGSRALGLDALGALGGGPVFDLSGRLVGLALIPSGRPAELLPASALQPLAAWAGWTAAAGAAPRRPYDEVYEQALPLTLQVLQVPPLPVAAAAAPR